MSFIRVDNSHRSPAVACHHRITRTESATPAEGQTQFTHVSNASGRRSHYTGATNNLDETGMLTENQNACSSNPRPETAPELKSVLHHALMRHNHHNRLTHPRPIWIRNPIRIKKTEPPPPIDAAPGRARSHEINTTQPTPSPHPSPTRSTRSSEEPAALLDHKDGAALPRSSAHRATGEGARGKRRSREEAGTVEGRTARGGGGAGRGGAGARPHSGVVRIPAARAPPERGGGGGGVSS